MEEDLAFKNDGLTTPLDINSFDEVEIQKTSDDESSFSDDRQKSKTKILEPNSFIKKHTLKK